MYRKSVGENKAFCQSRCISASQLSQVNCRFASRACRYLELAITSTLVIGLQLVTTIDPIQNLLGDPTNLQLNNCENQIYSMFYEFNKVIVVHLTWQFRMWCTEAMELLASSRYKAEALPLQQHNKHTRNTLYISSCILFSENNHIPQQTYFIYLT